jgi:hypothetical protein
MKRHLIVPFATLFCLTSSLAKAADLVEIRWDSTGAFVHSTSIAPGKFVEVCGNLTKDQRIDWSFVTGQATNFNIHYHVGKDVEFPERREGVTSLQAQLKVPLDQDYCWMWTNKHDIPVSLKLDLTRR